MEQTKTKDEVFIDPDHIVIYDIDEKRTCLPEKTNDSLWDIAKLTALIKTIMGKDLSRFSLPVFLNEPLTILQKTAEFMLFSDYLTRASEETDPFRRMIHLASFLSAASWCVNKRIGKPFISLLGETYEIVTDKFKFYGENVSCFPPILAINGRGKGFELNGNVNANMHFTGT